MKERGAKRVFAYARAPVFSGNAANNLRNSVIDEVVVCDTIPLTDEIKALPNDAYFDPVGMLAEAIRRIGNEDRFPPCSSIDRTVLKRRVLSVTPFV